jgi:hypothetical protein
MRTHRRHLPKLAFAWVILTTVPAAQGQSSQGASGPPLFVIDLDITGGFTGRGIGGVTVDARGDVRVSRRGGATRETPDCRSTLPADELDSLQRAVASMKPWPVSFAPPDDHGCCDRYRWMLRLEQRLSADSVQEFKTYWFDGNEERLSPDVKAIKDIAWRALTRALTGCGKL